MPASVPTTRRRVAVVVALALAVLMAGLLPPTATNAQEASEQATAAPQPQESATAQPSNGGTPARTSRPGEPAPIRAGLVRQLSDNGRADFWVRMKGRADLDAAAEIPDWQDRGAAVVAALQETAARSQRGVLARLEATDVAHEAHWASNAVLVRGGSAKLARTMADTAGVQELRAARTYEAPDPTIEEVDHEPQWVEWGVSNINADDVWDTGVTGEGIVVASIDTGVQHDHPALVEQYRGTRGNGTFDHDYNWFDASGACSDGPCDDEGHGTHTMGTMVGDDGAFNQIGVAPGATWITTNGCASCSDATLLAAGQWLLAPTRLDGSDPDPGMRPHIVNNSWGSEFPTTDPFLEDVSRAWEASGIFGVWSNGNSGPYCNSSTAPGSRTINYSVGAYDSRNEIARFSSRGAGQDGLVKPDIAAPGAIVRSADIDSGYRYASGTSMAAPHVAGAIALLWSAEPGRIGDLHATRRLLDETARDTADLSCGGTAEDNNVFGEGRLDALALVTAGEMGATGVLQGSVLDSEGQPVTGADVHVVGPDVDRHLPVDRAGEWSATLPVGTHDLTVRTFGYVTVTATVEVTTDTTVTHDVVLEVAPTATVAGTVTDGSGHGWPLYAKVTVAGVPQATTHTDPTTGAWAIELPVDDYELTVDPIYPGYTTPTHQVQLDADGANLDVAVPVDAQACVAHGYTFRTDGVLTEDFEAGQPDGWTVVDHIDSGGVWRFDNPGERANMTGGDGEFAIIDSSHYGAGAVQDTSLVTPVLDLSAQDAPGVRFRQDFDHLADTTADVDVSLDGGQTWDTVLHQQEDARSATTVLELPQAAGRDQVRLRFRFHQASFDYFWMVDEVYVGPQGCLPTVAGGYVTGTVHDANTDEPVTGARVHMDDTTLTTQRTPDDPALDDAFFWTFAPSGTPTLTAQSRRYVSRPETVDVVDDGAVFVELALDAGRIETDTDLVTATVEQGSDTATETIIVTNTGTAAAEVQLDEVADGFELRDRAATAATDAEVSPQDEPWVDIADFPHAVMDNGVVALDGKVYSIGGSDGNGPLAANRVFDPATGEWSPIASLPVATSGMTVGVIDGAIVATGGLQQRGLNPDTVIYDPDTDTWAVRAGGPSPSMHAGRAVLDEQLYAVGGCATDCLPGTDKVLRYDPALDKWDQLAPYPVRTSYLSCGGLADRVVCAGGSGDAYEQQLTYSYDPTTDEWTRVADAPTPYWGGAYAVANGRLVVAGGIRSGQLTSTAHAYDPVDDTWIQLPNSNQALYRGGAACGFFKVGGSAGFSRARADSEHLPGLHDCDRAPADVAWMSTDPTTVTLAPGDSATVEVTFSGDVDQPGDHTARLLIGEDTPYRVDPVPVELTVEPSATMGRLVTIVTAQACDDGTSPVNDAVVAVDSSDGAWTLRTDRDGRATRWVDVRSGELVLAASTPGHRPLGRVQQVKPGQTATVTFALTELDC